MHHGDFVGFVSNSSTSEQVHDNATYGYLKSLEISILLGQKVLPSK